MRRAIYELAKGRNTASNLKQFVNSTVFTDRVSSGVGRLYN